MKKTILVIITIFVFNLTVRSQDYATLLVRTLYSENTVNKMVDNYKNYFKQIAVSTYNNDLDSNYVEYMNYALNNMRGIIKSMVETDLVPLYNKIYTSDELKELSSFYGSPVGKKYLEKSPEVSKGVQNLMIEKYLPTIKIDLENYLKRNKNK